MAKAVPKKAAAKAGKSLTEPTPKEAAAPAVLSAHGVTLEFGDAKKGGTNKSALVTLLPLKAIKVLKGFNPRSVMGDLSDLTDSIKKEGLLTALVVRPSAKEGEFDLICGERRLRACQAIGIESVPVLIRGDLSGKDDESRAIAVAENSEDVRTALNPIEMGTVFAQLAKKAWSVATIASNCGVQPHRVRRYLSLMEAPEDIKKRVASGDMSANTGLVVAKMDPATRKALSEQLKGDLSAADVKKLAKEAGIKQEGEADGKQAKRKEGLKRDAALIVWRPAKVKQALLQRLCHTYVGATEEEKEQADFNEVRGAIGLLLWDRGDLSDDGYLLPPIGSEDPADAKVLKRVDALIAKEAKKFTPDAEEGAEEAAEAAASG